jgi:hypothetical protein
MRPGIWWGDEIGIGVLEGDQIVLGETRLVDIAYHICIHHGMHVRLSWNNGDTALATQQADGMWLSEPEDQEKMGPISAQARDHIRRTVAQELESQLAL